MVAMGLADAARGGGDAVDNACYGGAWGSGGKRDARGAVPVHGVRVGYNLSKGGGWIVPVVAVGLARRRRRHNITLGHDDRGRCEEKCDSKPHDDLMCLVVVN